MRDNFEATAETLFWRKLFQNFTRRKKHLKFGSKSLGTKIWFIISFLRFEVVIKKYFLDVPKFVNPWFRDIQYLIRVSQGTSITC